MAERSSSEVQITVPTSYGPGGSETVRGETTTVTVVKKEKDQKVGIEMGYTQDNRWLVIAAIHKGSLFSQFGELKPGAKLLDVKANGELFRAPSLQQAVALISGAVGELSLTIMPIVDRYGFIISADDFLKQPVTRDMLRHENLQLQKWQKRAATPKAWQEYAKHKPKKLDTRIRQGVPDPVRGFVWKLLAAARAPADFRVLGKYAELSVSEGGEAQQKTFEQIDKDVPRTMTEHIYFRQRGRTGQEALTRVLRAYALFHPQLGYTQGMSSYAAVLLLYLTEEDAFWTFATLMQHCGLAGLFSDGFPMLMQHYDTWQLLLRKHLPRLDKHIKSQLCGFLGVAPWLPPDLNTALARAHSPRLQRYATQT